MFEINLDLTNPFFENLSGNISFLKDFFNALITDDVPIIFLPLKFHSSISDRDAFEEDTHTPGELLASHINSPSFFFLIMFRKILVFVISCLLKCF